MPRYGYLLPTRGVVLASDDRDELTDRIERDVLGLARRVESLGFDGAWVGDSVLAKPRLDALSVLAAVAAVTDSIDLGTAVHLPGLRHPVHVAHVTATIDQLSGGRLRLGTGVGIGPDVRAEYDSLDLDYGTRGRRLDEVLDVVTALWTGEPVDYDGVFFQLQNASIDFAPARTPPIYIPTAGFDPSEGFPAPIRNRLLTHGDGWLPLAIDPDTYETSLKRIRSQLTAAGCDPDAFDPAYYVDVVIDDDEGVALEQAREFYDRYYPAWDPLSDEEIRARGAFGPIDTIVSTLEAYERAGVETMVVRFVTADQSEQLDRFADVVD